jgi:hypothetical protein
VNSGTSVQEAFWTAGVDRVSASSEAANGKRTTKLRKAAISALKVAMIRIDGLMEWAENDSDETKDELMKLRLSVHDLIGQFQEGRPASGTPKEEISSLVRDRFLVQFNSGRIKEIAKLRSGKRFTIFDDYPMWLMDLKQSLSHDLAVMKSSSSRDCAIEDLKVHLFGTGVGAVATFLFCQKHKKESRTYYWKSRVSFVFERENGKWRIVHEHWSEANPGQTVFRRIRKINDMMVSGLAPMRP